MLSRSTSVAALPCPSCSATGTQTEYFGPRSRDYRCEDCDGSGRAGCSLCDEKAVRIVADEPCCARCGALVDADIAALCSAGCDHEQLRRVDVLWNALEYVGMQSDDVETIELRNCSCHSTLARVIARVTEIQDGAGDVTYRAPIAAGVGR